jgi:Uma2 family endonuclease
VPDVVVMRAGVLSEEILDVPPVIAIEILSPDDQMAKLQQKIAEYLAFGVEHVWVFDNQKGKGKDKSRSFASLRMRTSEGWKG